LFSYNCNSDIIALFLINFVNKGREIMANSVGLSPVALARVELAQAKENLNTRLDSSRKIVTAFEYAEGNKKFFEESRDAIKQLVVRTDALGKALTTLEQAGIDAGSCKITVPGRLIGTKKVEKPVVEVQKEIQGNLDQDTVKVGLRTLGIIEEPKKSIFSLPEAPSGRSVAKVVGGLGVAAGVVTAGIYREKIITAAQGAIDYVKKFDCNGVNQGDKICQAYATLTSNQTVNQVLAHPATKGIALGAVAIGGIIAIAKVIKNRRNQQAEAAAAANAPVETPVNVDPKAKIA
jgi:hypothetical protein